MMPEAVIINAVRTPIGRHAGVLKSVRPDDMAALVIADEVADDLDPRDTERLDHAAQHAEHHLHRGRTRGSQAVDEVRLDLEALQPVADHRAAPVHHHRAGAGAVQRHHVLQRRVLRAERGATDLDDRGGGRGAARAHVV